MSRSKHTDPRRIRATRRIAAPRAERATGDLALRRRTGKLLKEIGVRAPHAASRDSTPTRFPRIIVRDARRGFYHPASRADVRRLLNLIGPEGIYGVRSVELTHAPVASGATWSVFGRLCVPGRILLYEQLRPPWRLTGSIAAADARLLTRAGAVIERREEIGITSIDWPGASLRRFMLLDVLLHEIGHHIVQHHTGKRRKRIARTRDHEAFAEAFAEKARVKCAALIDVG